MKRIWISILLFAYDKTSIAIEQSSKYCDKIISHHRVLSFTSASYVLLFIFSSFSKLRVNTFPFYFIKLRTCCGTDEASSSQPRHSQAHVGSYTNESIWIESANQFTSTIYLSEEKSRIVTQIFFFLDEQLCTEEIEIGHTSSWMNNFAQRKLKLDALHDDKPAQSSTSDPVSFFRETTLSLLGPSIPLTSSSTCIRRTPLATLMILSSNSSYIS